MTVEAVAAATVTYGDRAAMCMQVVERALSAGASRAVVIDNGSSPASSEQLRAWARERPEITVIHQARNEGSAAGFSAALSHASALGLPWIWLLDDDNLASTTALEAALALARGFPGRTAIACFRTADGSQAAVLDGAPVEETLDVRGSFVGFDVGARLLPKAGLWPREAVDHVEIPWAPYGGLLLPARAVQEVGLPHESFVLYGDDRDYSERLRSAGYRIILSRAATVDDIADRWSRDDQGSESRDGHLVAMIRSGDSRRAYYLVRNAVFDDRRRARLARARLRMTVNAAVFLTYVALQSVRLRRPGFLLLVARAAAAGWSGRWYSTAGPVTAE